MVLALTTQVAAVAVLSQPLMVVVVDLEAVVMVELALQQTGLVLLERLILEAEVAEVAVVLLPVVMELLAALA